MYFFVTKRVHTFSINVGEMRCSTCLCSSLPCFHCYLVGFHSYQVNYHLHLSFI